MSLIEPLFKLVGSIVGVFVKVATETLKLIWKIIEIFKVPILCEFMYKLVSMFFLRVCAFGAFIYLATIHILAETKNIFLKIMVPVVYFLRIPQIGLYLWQSFVWFWLLTIDILAEICFGIYYYTFKFLEKFADIFLIPLRDKIFIPIIERVKNRSGNFKKAILALIEYLKNQANKVWTGVLIPCA